MTDAPVDLSKTLWTAEFPRARYTRWHQTFQEVTAQVGQQIGFALGMGHTKGLDVRIEIEFLGGKTLRVSMRGSAEEEFLVLDAHVETSQ